MSKRILLKGIVQGVGCRQYCIRYARKNLFSGCVSNLRDGNVELLLDDSGRSEGEISRITSYNVCYTKLLRIQLLKAQNFL